MDYLKFATHLLTEATAKKKCKAEVYLNHTKGLSIDFQNRKIENLQNSISTGVGLRVQKNKKQGLSYTNQLGTSAIRDLIQGAFSNLRHSPPDKFISFPGRIRSRKRCVNLGTLYDPNMETVAFQEKIDLLRKMEKQSLSINKISKVLRVSYHQEIGEDILVNSLGISNRRKATICCLGIEVIAKDKSGIQTGGEIEIKHSFKHLHPEEIIQTACQRATMLLGARKIKTQKIPVILDNPVAIEFLEMVAHSVSAEMKQKGKSLFAHKENKQVASKLVTIVDDGILPDGIGTAPFDVEGVPTQTTILIKNGVLKNFLYDTYTANKDKTKSTGNATRSFAHPPGVGTTNFFLQRGNMQRDALFTPLDKGLYITQTIGMHTVNPVSGDFSVGVSGIWIEKGKLTYPVHGITMAGNILQLLQDIDGVGEDLKFYGSCGSPTIRLKQAIISGE